MWLTVGQRAIELVFEHTHDGRRHRHPIELASIEAHQLCHRLDGRELRRSTLQQ